MQYNIFHLDWIFIDTVIIILLLVFLISVKLFKEKMRWRSKFSNSNLENYKFKKNSYEVLSKTHIINEFSVTINQTLKNERELLPTIIIFYIHKPKKVLSLLIEGLASYGFRVIKINYYKKLVSNRHPNDAELQNKISNSISNIIDICLQKNLIKNPKYYSIFNHNFFLSNSSNIHENNNIGLILLNPILYLIDKWNFSELFSSTKLVKFLIIFSKKSKFYFNNRDLKKFLNKYPNYNKSKIKIIILEKSTKSFKYYETILLSMITNLIDSN
ncbi:MAG: hypothetical protein ACFFAO_01740 [Candidatus Hermodarchaeota archaeon]